MLSFASGLPWVTWVFVLFGLTPGSLQVTFQQDQTSRRSITIALLLRISALHSPQKNLRDHCIDASTTNAEVAYSRGQGALKI